MSGKCDHIENGREVGGDYFRLIYSRKCNKKLEDHLSKFNPDDYWIVKATRHQRFVSYDELLEFKYAGYTLFKKDLYDIDKIFKWIDFFNELCGIQYLVKPIPPFSLNKIIVRK